MIQPINRSEIRASSLESRQINQLSQAEVAQNRDTLVAHQEASKKKSWLCAPCRLISAIVRAIFNFICCKGCSKKANADTQAPSAPEAPKPTEAAAVQTPTEAAQTAVEEETPTKAAQTAVKEETPTEAAQTVVQTPTEAGQTAAAEETSAATAQILTPPPLPPRAQNPAVQPTQAVQRTEVQDVIDRLNHVETPAETPAATVVTSPPLANHPMLALVNQNVADSLYMSMTSNRPVDEWNAELTPEQKARLKAETRRLLEIEQHNAVQRRPAVSPDADPAASSGADSTASSSADSTASSSADHVSPALLQAYMDDFTARLGVRRIAITGDDSQIITPPDSSDTE